jgi:excisionase family DNA binding protein
MTKIMKLVDVARHLGIPKRTLYDMINSGRFPVEPIPGTKPRRWNFEDVEAWRSPSKEGITNEL